MNTIAADNTSPDSDNAEEVHCNYGEPDYSPNVTDTELDLGDPVDPSLGTWLTGKEPATATVVDVGSAHTTAGDVAG